jgi:hypothetical protein
MWQRAVVSGEMSSRDMIWAQRWIPFPWLSLAGNDTLVFDTLMAGTRHNRYIPGLAANSADLAGHAIASLMAARGRESIFAPGSSRRRQSNRCTFKLMHHREASSLSSLKQTYYTPFEFRRS